MTREQLQAACQAKTFVRFERPFEEGTTTGYVLDVAADWFVLAKLGDGIRLDGFQCHRIGDVRELEDPSPYADFYAAALAKRGEARPATPDVGLSDIEALLESANRAFPLVTIHTEEDDPDVCWIGRVARIKDARVSLLEISPSAEWDDEPTDYQLEDITRVDFGGAYEEALHLVGGEPPTGAAGHAPR